MVKVIMAITSFNLNLWRSRCSQVLGGMGNHRIWKKREHLLAQVNYLVKDQSVLMMNGKYHINSALGDNARVCNILVWIGTTRALYCTNMQRRISKDTQCIGSRCTSGGSQMVTPDSLCTIDFLSSLEKIWGVGYPMQ
jgi:hypothetical protein